MLFMENLQRYRREGERIRLQKLKRIIRIFFKLWHIKCHSFLCNIVSKMVSVYEDRYRSRQSKLL
jgi:hypothetical protein